MCKLSGKVGLQVKKRSPGRMAGTLSLCVRCSTSVFIILLFVKQVWLFTSGTFLVFVSFCTSDA